MQNIIKEVIKRLETRRGAFHNEADLQFEFAWEINRVLLENNIDNRIRLEHFVENEKNKREYIDLLIVINENERYMFEFKYKLKKDVQTFNNEKYKFYNHGAQNLSAAAIFRDIKRLEKQVLENGVKEGYVIFLTNEKRKFNFAKSKSITGIKDFSLFNEQTDTFTIDTNKKYHYEHGKRNDKNEKGFKCEFEFKKDYRGQWESFNDYFDCLIIKVMK